MKARTLESGIRGRRNTGALGMWGAIGMVAVCVALASGTARAEFQWTWMKGASTEGQPGTYGTQGTPAPGNTPGARQSALSWIDGAGALWLFGGSDGTMTGSLLNDLWKYDPATGDWAWMKGASTADQPGTYGTQGTPAPGNTPGARESAVSWIDGAGALWLFGGFAPAEDHFNDLWKYDPATGDWTWMKGASTVDQPGTYGTQGTPAPGNTPGARLEAVSWIDGAGALWLFGGVGYGGAGSYGLLNDLWKYEPATGDWTWMKGPSTIDQSGTYGTQETPAPGNTPGGRYSAVSWIDGAGALWLFGGRGYDGAGSSGLLNDLWKYEPATGDWTWMKGASTYSPYGTYGTQGTAAPGNTPGGRESAVSWIDGAGALWLFGGEGLPGVVGHGYLNDLWKYEPATGDWTWIKGASTTSQPGTYGTQGTPAPGNTPGARGVAVSWIDGAGALWLFGGYGYDGVGSFGGPLNDLWRGGLSLAATPVAPVVSNPTRSTLDVAIGSGDGNLATIEYAIRCVTASQWVRADGTLGALAVWQNAAAWATTTVTGLNGATSYAFRTRARDDEAVETSYGPSASGGTDCVLSYTAGVNGTLLGTAPQTVDYGGNGTAVEAVPDVGHYFANWSDNSTNNPRTDTNVSDDITVTAIFLFGEAPKIPVAGLAGAGLLVGLLAAFGASFTRRKA